MVDLKKMFSSSDSKQADNDLDIEKTLASLTTVRIFIGLLLGA
jgi:hypothetical protein